MKEYIAFVFMFFVCLLIPINLICHSNSFENNSPLHFKNPLKPYKCKLSNRVTYLSEGFDTTIFPPSTWQITPSPSWIRTDNSGHIISGNASAMFRSTGNTNNKRLITPLVRIEPFSYLSFKTRNSTINYNEQLKIRYSSNGSIWNTIQTISLTNTAISYSLDLSSISMGDYYLCFETLSTAAETYTKTYIVDDVVGPVLTSSIEYGNLEGYVRISQNNLPINGATLTIGTESILSDEFGYYNFNNIYTGEYDLYCQATDYISASVPVAIQPDSTAICDVYLNPVLVPLAPANVIISRTDSTFVFSWGHSDYADGYRLYTSAEPDSMFEFLIQTTENSITLTDDWMLANGVNPHRAFFLIYAFNE